MLVFQILVTGLLLMAVAMMVLNFISQPSLASFGFKRRFDKTAPLVSVLVPARNEAGNIASCIRSLLKQDYPNLEIIVLDDNSEDATANIVEMLNTPSDDPHGRLSLLKGTALADGWLGKNYACHQLAHAAQGDYMLFTDADTEHNPNAVSGAVAAMEAQEVDFLSVFPLQSTASFAERLAVPLTLLYVYALLPIWQVRRSLNTAFSAANGQFMLFQREAYEHIGGHAAIKGVVLEDVILARRIKQAGLRASLPDGRDSVTCRMYHNGSQVWRGFSKNLYAFFGFNSGWLALFLLINWLAFVFPYFWLAWGAIFDLYYDPSFLWLPLAQIGLSLVLRLLLTLRFKYRLSDVLLQPFSVVYMTAIAINSVRWHHNVTEWKGRKYKLSPAPGEKEG